MSNFDDEDTQKKHPTSVFGGGEMDVWNIGASLNIVHILYK